MKNVLDTLSERGFVDQTTHDEELRAYLEDNQATCYIGFDPTASSLHVGSLVPIMALAQMQRHGHRPIALVGGGTGLVGDPSGKTETRKLLTQEKVSENAKGIKKQLSRYLNFHDNHAFLLNNADWLVSLNYIDFLRDVGRYFSVNRMIKAESYKMRLDSDEGLNFIEFNYMLLQSYDFLTLFDQYDCCLQMGGSDQWGNIVAGIELVRRVKKEAAFGITFPLITTSSGAKMGKTAVGAIWLDPDRTSPYEYYQFWVNTDDLDITRFLALFTFLPMDEIRAVEELNGADLNYAKAVLAFEATNLAHGYEAALESHNAAVSMFGNRIIPKEILPSSQIVRENLNSDDDGVPKSEISADELKMGIPAFKLFYAVGLATSSGAARRLIEQGGGYLNNKRIEEIDELVSNDHLINGEILLRAGKKRFHKVLIK